MKTVFPRFHFIVWLAVLAPLALGAQAITFTNDTTIAASNTNYEGADVVVANCTVTADGPHAFSSLLVAAGGTLTHSFSPNGSISNLLSVVDESQVLNDTNPVTLLNSNVVMASVVVADSGKTLVYTNGVDYLLTDLMNGLVQLQRTTNSTIPDGGTVLVNYYVLLLTTPAGLNLTVAGNVEVSAGGFINVNGKGYAGAYGPGSGHGSSSSPMDGSGAGYGGSGGMSSSNAIGGGTYGSFIQPTAPGSGGGASYAGTGGIGGGVVQLAVGGDVIINGMILANGANGTNSRSGGGSGGSIWITAHQLSGSGAITANGGAGEPIHGGGGGGGRIAIQCDANSFAGAMTAYGGVGARTGGAGTVYTKLTAQNGLLVVDNGGRAGTNSLMAVANGADVLIRGNASVIPSGSWSIGNLTIGSNSLLVATSQSTVNLTATGNVAIQPGGSLLADSAGYPAGTGTGRGSSYSGTGYPCGGGGHGGSGANGSAPNTGSSISYGSQASPNTYGSGGGSFPNQSIGGAGGGAIRLNVSGILQVDGRISANGGNGSGSGGGGGSGGCIWITSGLLVGAGSITANGGNGADSIGGGGGGGRIALYPSANLFGGVISAFGGGGASWGGAGTVFIQTAGQNGQLILDNAGHLGSNTPLQSAVSSDLTVRNGAVGSAIGVSFANLLVASNGWLVLPVGSQTSSTALNVTVSANATIQAGGGIMADAMGNPAGQGSGAGRYNYYISTYPCSGAGHGGYGASSIGNYAAGGGVYDYTMSPTAAGSGGGTYSGYSTGGAGGGAIKLVVSGALQVAGKISANGGNGSGSGGGGGSGGSVWLILGTFSGSGSITANGGNGADAVGGGGGGGRIAIYYNNNSYAGTISAYGGGGANSGGAGTVYLKANSQTYGQLTLDNGGNAGTNTTFVDASLVDLFVAGKAVGQLPSGTWSVRNLQIRTNGLLIAVASSAQQTFNVTGNATIDPGGALAVDGAGYSAQTGPGSGRYTSSYRGGGGHGGFGGANPSFGGGVGGVYGSIQSPATAGSGGASGSGTSIAPLGGAGGGALRLAVTGTLIVNGRLSTEGKNGDVGSGGGSGGSLWITAGTLAGSGIISANGGSGNGIGGGGGGGRIALGYSVNVFNGPISAYGGAGYVQGGAGTIYTKANSQSVGQVLVDNGGVPGTNTPLSTVYGMPASASLTVGNGAVASWDTPSLVLSNLTIASGGMLTSVSPQTNLDLVVLKNALVAAGGAIAVDGKGFSQGNGPGAGQSIGAFGSGAGYGGLGGASATAPGGTNYGSAQQPGDRGSGGGLGWGTPFGGSEGGGAIRLNVGGTLTVDGQLSANGNMGLQDDSGGGSGGSIWVTAGALAGNGQLSADGGEGELSGGGGGAGGRIALYSHANIFAGTVSAAGADGDTWGADGSIYYGTNFSLQILSHTPAGIVSNAASFVDLVFNAAPASASFSGADVSLMTPNGPLSPAGFAVSMLSSSRYRCSFPQQTAVGNYTLAVGPNINDLYGQPMSQVYTGAFTILLPVIQGAITDTNGLPIAGVLLQPDGGLAPTLTDSNGSYALGFVPGSSFTVVPSQNGLLFVPASLAYTNVTTSISNQKYLAVTTIAPAITTELQDTNFVLGWCGIPGVNYQVYSSTNLVDWLPYGDAFSCSNSAVQIPVPIASDPVKFFRVQANN